MYRIPMVVLAAMLGVSACKVTTRAETLHVGDYSRVDNDCDAELIIRRGDLEPGDAEVDCNGNADVNLKVNADGTLVISGDDAEDCVVTVRQEDVTSLVVRGNGDVRAVGDWDGLEMLDVRGGGAIHFDAIATEDLQLEAGGSGEVVIESLEAGYLGMELSGDGDVSLAGHADQADILVTGSGSLYAKDLDVTDLVIRMSGSGDAEITASGSVDAEVSGDGHLDLWGNPRVLGELGLGITLH